MSDNFITEKKTLLSSVMTIRNIAFFIFFISMFTIILLQNYNIKKHLKKLQISTQLITQNLSDIHLQNDNTKKHLEELQISTHSDITISGIKKQYIQVQKLLKNIDLNSQALLKNAMAEKVESITKNKGTTEEKVIAIAQWISSHIANNNEFGSNVYTWFADRNGLCGMRSSVFVEMLKYINVYSAVYNICEFPTCNHAHSTAQVYYNNEWHFFDVTYAGYFKKEGKILSFEEIIELSKKEDALKYLITFEETMDYCRPTQVPSLHLLSRDEITKIPKINNQIRMHQVYARDHLLNAVDYRFYDGIQCSCQRQRKK